MHVRTRGPVLCAAAAVALSACAHAPVSEWAGPPALPHCRAFTACAAPSTELPDEIAWCREMIETLE